MWVPELSGSLLRFSYQQMHSTPVNALKYRQGFSRRIGQHETGLRTPLLFNIGLQRRVLLRLFSCNEVATETGQCMAFKT